MSSGPAPPWGAGPVGCSAENGQRRGAVTRTATAFVREPGVVNQYVQDVCPFDPVGHLNEAYDLNVWKLVENALDPAHAKSFFCTAGLPG
jgi:hypothetical protein